MTTQRAVLVVEDEIKLAALLCDYLRAAGFERVTYVDRTPWLAAKTRAELDELDGPLRARLTARWQHYNLTPDEIAWKLDGNDLPNGRFVMATSRNEDFRLKNG